MVNVCDRYPAQRDIGNKTRTGLAEKYLSETNLRFLLYDVFDTASLDQYSHFAGQHCDTTNMHQNIRLLFTIMNHNQDRRIL